MQWDLGLQGLGLLIAMRIIIAGHAFTQNVRRGHYELAVEEPMHRRLTTPSTSLPWRSDSVRGRLFIAPRAGGMQQRLQLDLLA